MDNTKIQYQGRCKVFNLILVHAVHVVGEIQVYEFKEWRSLDESPQLVNPSQKSVFWYEILQ